MKRILVLGTIPNDKISFFSDYKFVQKPEEADFVVLTDSIKSYFLGTTLGALIEQSYSLELTKGTPKVLTLSQFEKERKTDLEVGF